VSSIVARDYEGGSTASQRFQTINNRIANKEFLPFQGLKQSQTIRNCFKKGRLL
jgi:hypothetical protein